MSHAFSSAASAATGSAAPPSPAVSAARGLVKEDESSLTIIRSVLAAGKAAAAEKKAAAAGSSPSGALDSGSVVRLLRLLRPEAPRLAGALATLSVTTGISLLFPYAIGHVLDVALAPSGLLSPASISGGLMVLFGVQSALIVLRSNLLTVAGERLSAGIRRDLFKSVLSQDLAWFDRQRTGDIINRLSSDTSALQAALTTQVTGGLRSVFMVVGGTGMLFYLSPTLAALSMVLIPPVAAAGITYGRYVEGQQRAVQEALGRTMEVAQELVSNVRTVRQYAREREEGARFDGAVGESYRLARRIGIVSGWFDASVHFAANLGLIAVLGYGGTQIASGAMSAGDLTAFLMYSLYTGFNLGNLSRVYSELKRAAGVAGRIYEVADSAPTIPLSSLGPRAYWEGGGGGGSGSGTVVMERIELAAAAAAARGAQQRLPQPLLRPSSVAGRLSFQGVSFAYPTRGTQLVLKGLTLEVPPGCNLALVGASGCGKSTVGTLLTRLYDPCLAVASEGGTGSGSTSASSGGQASAGVILLDGQDIRTLDPTWLREQIAVVPQEPVLFATSIRDNIRYGQPGACQEAVEAAAHSAHAHGFITSFAQGYDTRVGERGAQLSGGQRQRVAIARAILKNAPILILDVRFASGGWCVAFRPLLSAPQSSFSSTSNIRCLTHARAHTHTFTNTCARTLQEATSALDSESEAGVQEAISQLSSGRTCITIAHRLSTIRNADLVAVLAGGVVVEQGTFSELYNKSTSAFRQFVDAQTL